MAKNLKRILVTDLIYSDVIQDICNSMSYGEIRTFFSKRTNYKKAAEILEKRRTWFEDKTCVALDKTIERIEEIEKPIAELEKLNKKGGLR